MVVVDKDGTTKERLVRIETKIETMHDDINHLSATIPVMMEKMTTFISDIIVNYATKDSVRALEKNVEDLIVNKLPRTHDRIDKVNLRITKYVYYFTGFAACLTLIYELYKLIIK